MRTVKLLVVILAICLTSLTAQADQARERLKEDLMTQLAQAQSEPEGREAEAKHQTPKFARFSMQAGNEYKLTISKLPRITSMK